MGSGTVDECLLAARSSLSQVPSCQASRARAISCGAGWCGVKCSVANPEGKFATNDHFVEHGPDRSEIASDRAQNADTSRVDLSAKVPNCPVPMRSGTGVGSAEDRVFGAAILSIPRPK
jgi:hypothetical protein